MSFSAKLAGLWYAALPSRALIIVSGAEGEAFLNNILTQNIETLNDGGGALYGALLTPQGKLCHDFFIWREGEDFLLDVHAPHADMLQQRLEHYRLAADISIARAPRHATQLWGEGAEKTETGFIDPRHSALGRRIWHKEEAWTGEGIKADEQDWRTFCATLGVPDVPHNARPEAVFPHEFNLDLMGAIDYKKGCFVGQEVVSRVKRLGSARRRIMRVQPVEGESLPAGASIEAGGVVLGEVLPQPDLAHIRLDRLARAQAKEAAPVCGGRAVALSFGALFAPSGEG